MTISVEILVSIFFLLLIPIIISVMWVRGIDYMHKNHPDYKGYDLFDETEDNTKDEDNISEYIPNSNKEYEDEKDDSKD
jgi:hypothetical protein